MERILGDDVVGERFSRETSTRDVRQRSSKSAAGRNLGEITREDVDKVVTDGRDPRRFVRRRDEDQDEGAVALPARLVHSGSSYSRRVDREDAHEVDRRMRNGNIRTDRFDCVYYLYMLIDATTSNFLAIQVCDAGGGGRRRR